MNIELEEVVVMDVSDDALELAAGGAQGGVMTHTPFHTSLRRSYCSIKVVCQVV
jgi:hypothetical protein